MNYSNSKMNHFGITIMILINEAILIPLIIVIHDDCSRIHHN